MDRRTSGHRKAFTLTELLVVIGIIVLLTTLTIGAINLGVTSEQIRGGARQVQSLIEGARDRAIYAGEARGIRLLVDDADPTICRTIVYIGTAGAYESEEDVRDIDRDGSTTDALPYGPWEFDTTGDGEYDTIIHGGPTVQVVNPAATGGRHFLIGNATRFRELNEQRLIRGGSRIGLGIDALTEARRHENIVTIHPASFPIRSEQEWFGGDANGNGVNDPEVLLIFHNPLIENHSAGVTTAMLPDDWHFSIETEAEVLPSEEPSVLPKNCCIDLATSHLPSSWVVTNPDGTRQYSNRMDLLFTPGGAVTGSAAGSGLIHLHISHSQDAIDNVPPGSQTLDGTPNGPPRQGDEFGVTIFTQSGRVNVHPIDWSGYPVPANSVSNTSHPGYWQPGMTYSQGDRVAPTLYDGNTYVAVAVNGPSGGSEPTWNRLAGGQTREGDVVWRAERHDVWRLGLEGELAR